MGKKTAELMEINAAAMDYENFTELAGGCAKFANSHTVKKFYCSKRHSNHFAEKFTLFAPVLK